MMGRLNHDQGQLFYSFSLGEAVPDEHHVRAIASVLDLSWIHGEFAPYYPKIGRLSIDPALMIPMLIVLRVWDPLGSDAVPRRAGELRLSVVLWALD
jgi:hypothetical protein